MKMIELLGLARSGPLEGSSSGNGVLIVREVPNLELYWPSRYSEHSSGLVYAKHELHLKSANLRVRSTKEGYSSDTRNTSVPRRRKSGEDSFVKRRRHGESGSAHAVEESLHNRDVTSWTSLILQHMKRGRGRHALQIYKQMHECGVTPSSHTFVAVLRVCCKLQDLERVREVHADIHQHGFNSHIHLGSMLIDVYAKCGSLVDARLVFEKMPRRNVVSWTAMILSYAQAEQGNKALQLYRRMQHEGVLPNDRTFVAALKACSSLALCETTGRKHDALTLNKGCLEQVRSIHSDLLKGKFESDVFVGTMLVDAYAKCGSLLEARRVFECLPVRNVICWTAMILGHAHMKEGEEALRLYARMQEEGIIPNDRSYVGALKACSSLAALEEWNKGDHLKMWCLKQVRAIHSDVLKADLEMDLHVGTMLVDVYAKCGSLGNARCIFEKMPLRNVISWTAMILGYAQMEGGGDEALQLYARMQREGIAPDDRAFLGALKACASVAGLEKGKEIHLQILEAGLGVSDLFLANSLIDMYSKCGSMQEARQVFEAMPARDIVSWSALVSGYARRGESQMVFHLFDQMRQQGMHPNGVTFLAVLTACSHGGLVDKGQQYFEAMSREFNILPSIEHYNCMVDLLGRAGQVRNAIAMIDSMPFPPDCAMWETVLSACQKWGDVELGTQAFESALELGKSDTAAHVLEQDLVQTFSTGLASSVKR